jgi:hypothetical protein
LCVSEAHKSLAELAELVMAAYPLRLGSLRNIAHSSELELTLLEAFSMQDWIKIKEMSPISSHVCFLIAILTGTMVKHGILN